MINEACGSLLLEDLVTALVSERSSITSPGSVLGLDLGVVLNRSLIIVLWKRKLSFILLARVNLYFTLLVHALTNLHNMSNITDIPYTRPAIDPNSKIRDL